MSIIESAYIKSKGKANPDLTEKEMIEEIVAEEKKMAKSRYKAPDDLGASRRDISNMEQGTVFTELQLAEKNLISPSMKDTVLLNKYRNLRTKLLASSEQENFVTLVTSVTPNSGSSQVSTNLALAFALDEGKTSLLIDANINKPSLANILDLDVDIGLIDYLESDTLTCEKILRKTPVPRVRLLPSGHVRVNAAEYFTSDKMKALIQSLLTRYPERFPIIDAPSITQSADTRILIELCDKVILVVPYGKCSKDEINYAALAVGRDKLAGIILNEF